MAFDPNTEYSIISNELPYFVYSQGGKYYRSTDLVEIPSVPEPPNNGIVNRTLVLTQAQYDEIVTKDGSTLYCITA